jgi:hypothetical protein
MVDKQNIGNNLYGHYSQSFVCMSDDDRICLGSAFRSIHEVTEALRQLNLSADSVPIEGWQDTVNMEWLSDQGYELKFEIWLILGPVGQLAKLTDECKYISDDASDITISEKFFNYPNLPDPESLFLRKIISAEWMDFLRRLRDCYQALDVELKGMTSDPAEVRFFLFRGYLLVTMLHQALSILEFAEQFAWREKSLP